MAIRLITGNPGAGKTVYAVSKVIKAIVGQRVTLESGETVERRIVVAGIRGLILAHERLPHKLTGETVLSEEVDRYNALMPGSTDQPAHQRLPGSPPVEGVPALVQTWWLWCKPGDLIVVDEVQFLAPRGTMGRKPPYWVQALEVHRHYGVDFVVITQHPQLIDPTIRALVGHHEHVRSIMGSSLCSVYTWDHASNPERFTLANKSVWKRGKADYRLFNSSVAHIKPPSAGRSVMVVLPLLVLGLVGGVYAFTGKWREKLPQSVEAQASADRGPLASLAASSAGGAVVDERVIAGCWSVGEDCKCIDGAGRRQVVAPTVCRASAAGYSGELPLSALAWAPQAAPLSVGQYGAAARGSNAGVAVSDQH